MVIDTHVHAIVPDFVRGSFVRANAKVGAATYNHIHKTALTADQYIDLLKARADPDCTKLIATMDRAGIDKSVIFGVDWAYGLTGEPKVTNREQNRFHADMATKSLGRLIALAALDPRRPDVIEQADEAIEKWGMKGFKIHPSAGFYPNDPVCFPLYKKCAKWGVPIVFHSGGGEGSWECGQPMYIASAAERFPEVRMVMAHAGSESWQQALQAAAFLPNVFLDVSVTGQWLLALDPQEFYRWLRRLIDWAGPWKILFASDSPLPTFWMPQEMWVKAIREPATDIRFTPEEIAIVLGKAAEAVFNFS